MTHKRVAAIIIFLWVFSSLISLLTLWVLFDAKGLIIIILGFVFVTFTTSSTDWRNSKFR